jgi:hypothetical protein
MTGRKSPPRKQAKRPSTATTTVSVQSVGHNTNTIHRDRIYGNSIPLPSRFMKDPKNRDDELNDQQTDPVAQEVVESLDGYKDYMKEQRGDSLNFGDY